MRRFLLLAAALTLIATQSLAVGIKNTKHDLSASGSGTIQDTAYSEICVFCHTPHRADTSNTNAPLWNRSGLADINIVKIYNSATLNPLSKDATALTAINDSDAPLCLSCHITTYLTKNLRNPSNINGVDTQPVTTGWTLSANAEIGIELHDDHPIGMPYATVQSTDDEFRAPSGSGVSQKVSSLNLYTNTGVMWCSSCHDVHNNTYAPFLATNNTGSGLCLTCHIK